MARDCVEDYDCGRLCGLCSRWSPQHRYDTCMEEQEAVKDNPNWLLKELKKKVKALPEILLGPKWKNTCFMRRLKICIGWNNKKIRRMQFQYDPKSYALNFDDGKENEGDGVYLDFSARYACPMGIINKVHSGLGEQ